MTEKEAKVQIEKIKVMQESGAMLPCPRCGLNNMGAEIKFNRLSSRADVYICHECRRNEAIRSVFNRQLPLSEWAVIKEK